MYYLLKLLRKDEDEDKYVEYFTYSYNYVIRCTNVYYPSIETLNGKHTVELPDCAHVVMGIDDVICVA